MDSRLYMSDLIEPQLYKSPLKMTDDINQKTFTFSLLENHMEEQQLMSKNLYTKLEQLSELLTKQELKAIQMHKQILNVLQRHGIQQHKVKNTFSKQLNELLQMTNERGKNEDIHANKLSRQMDYLRVLIQKQAMINNRKMKDLLKLKNVHWNKAITDQLKKLVPSSNVCKVYIAGNAINVTALVHYDEKNDTATFISQDGNNIIVNCKQIAAIELNET